MRSIPLPFAAALICLPLSATAETAQDWWVSDLPLLTLYAGEDPSVIVTCPEAAGRLDVVVVPAWEEGYGTADGGTFAGPYDKVEIRAGDKSFAAVEDPAATSDHGGRVYTMSADADTVTAVMLATNLTVTLTPDGQERAGVEDTTGALDLFATTCAQINGL